MAGNNGQSNDHEGRITKLEEARQHIEDALVVMAYLDEKSAERIKEHAQLLVDHDHWMKHIQDKLDALTDIIMRREGGSEART